MSIGLLGKKVSYVRLNEKDEVMEGTGFVFAEFIAEDGRVQVRVKDGVQSVNTDLASVNLTEDGKARYLEGYRAIRKRAKEINDGIKEMTTAGNAEIELLYTKYLGAPATVDE